MIKRKKKKATAAIRNSYLYTKGGLLGVVKNLPTSPASRHRECLVSRMTAACWCQGAGRNARRSNSPVSVQKTVLNSVNAMVS